MLFNSIAIKLTIPILLLILCINGILIAYNTMDRRNRLISSAHDHILAIARDHSGVVKAEIEKALNIARTLADSFSAAKDPDSVLSLGREPVKTILKKTLKSNSSFLAAYTIWEPDAFDLLDEAFSDLAAHDETGRFIPYWTRDSEGNIVLEPARDYETEAKGGYYSIPRNTKKETVIDPYLYTLRGKQILMLSLVAPVMFDNRFYGVVGVDLSLDLLQNILDNVFRYEQNAKINIISNNGILAAVSGEPSLAGKRFDVVYPYLKDDLSSNNNGKQRVVLADGNLVVFTPIYIGNTQTPWTLNIIIPSDSITARAFSDIWAEIGISTILTLITVFVIAFIINIKMNPLRRIAESAEKVASGRLSYGVIVTADDEIGKVNDSFKKMVFSLKEINSACQALAAGDFSQPVQLRSNEDILGQTVNIMVENIRKIVKQLNNIAKGGYSAKFKPFSDKDQLGTAIAELISSLRKMAEENESQNILKTGNMELNAQMRGEKDISSLSDNIITYLCRYMNAPIGAFYVMDEEGALILTGSFAYEKRKNHFSRFLPGEGLTGQAFLEKQIIVITDVPEDYVRIQSGLGNAIPKSIVLCPLVFENSVKGIIEIGAFQGFSDVHLSFLNQVSESIAIAINSAQIRTRMKTLLEHTQQQADMLQSQQEALRKSNLDLEKQADALKQSESMLKEQQEELRHTNEELQEQAQLLEEQKEDIQKKNLELEMAGRLIKEKVDDLERTSKYKSEFLANMSHELRTPLNSILLLSRLVADNKDGNLTKKQVDFADTIHASGSDLLNLINEVLDLSKVEAGKMELNPEEIHIKDIASTMKRDFQHLSQKKELGFVIEISDGLPVSIFTDRQRTEQIIKNFLSNAFKFTSSGKITFSVSRPSGNAFSQPSLTRSNSIAFSVSDTGIGIPVDKQQIVFEAFKQADGTTSRKYGGTGLGLSISVELAKYLGGEIQLESEEGKGSSFTLILPEIFEQPGMEDKGKRQGTLKNGEDESVNNLTGTGKATVCIDALHDDRKNLNQGDRVILIVEDDPHFAKILSNISRSKGFKILLADNGQTGLHFADYYKPDAIILDVDLPQMDGLSVLARLKENINTGHIPVFFVSAFDKTSDALQMGAAGYAVKPVSLDDLEKIYDKINHIISESVKPIIISEPGEIKTECLSNAMDITVYDKEDVLKNKKILLVDDDMRNVYAITNILEEKGMKVIVGKNGKEGVERLNKETGIDLVLMDIMMPVMNGYEAMKETRKDKRFEKLPIIALTAKAMKGDRSLCIEAGANDYLAKPFDTEKLLSMLRVWLY